MNLEDKGDNATKLKDSGAATTPYIDLPSRFDRWEPVAEVVATIVLAIATLATAWSGYQAARWGGVQSTSYSQAAALRTESVRTSNQAGQLAQIDILPVVYVFQMLHPRRHHPLTGIGKGRKTLGCRQNLLHGSDIHCSYCDLCALARTRA